MSESNEDEYDFLPYFSWKIGERSLVSVCTLGPIIDMKETYSLLSNPSRTKIQPFLPKVSTLNTLAIQSLWFVVFLTHRQ